MFKSVRRRNQVLVPHELLDQVSRGQVVKRFYFSYEMQRLAANFVIEDKFGQAESKYKVQHPGTRNGIYTSDRSPQRATKRFSAALRIEKFPIT